jgi:hypothetical protein
MSKRFLRDNVLDDMLHEIRVISDRVTEAEFPTLMFTQSITAISEMYETNKIILEHLETIIEQVRDDSPKEDILQKAVEAAAHVQIGLVSVHTALKQDIDTLMSSIESLKDSLGMMNTDLPDPE